MYSLYVTKNQEIYNEDKQLEYFQDINHILFNQKYKAIKEWIPQRVLIYADNEVRYKFIDKIKQYIPKKWIFYMTDNIEGLKAISFRHNFYNKNLYLSKISTLEQDIKNEGNSTFAPLPPPLAWYHQFEDDIYSGDKSIIEQALKN